MKTKEERGLRYVESQCNGCRNEEKKGRYIGYIQGAKEQKEIDAHGMDFMSKRIAELAEKENALREKLVATATKAKLVADDVLGDRNRKNEAKGVLCICWELLDFIDNYGKEE